MERIEEDLVTLDKELFKILKENSKNYTYGTSGFRYKGSEMKVISLRVGLFMDYLAKFYYPQALGIVITASHNPKVDNGLKLVNPEGEMLDWDFEELLDRYINTEDLESAVENMRKDIRALFKEKEPSTEGLVFIARDTRESGPVLYDLITKYSTIKLVNFGQLSTPIVYYLVAHYNEHRDLYPQTPDASFVEHYFSLINKGFSYNIKRHFKAQPRFNVVIDCSNGVGSLMMEKFREKSELFQRFQPTLIYNDDWENLNVDCGAEWVHKYGKATPKFLAVPEDQDKPNICFVFDGDADRIVFYLRTQSGSDQVKVGDGNRICVLFARTLVHFKNLLIANKDKLDTEALDELVNAKIGVVYTAYSNNAFVDYATDVLKIGAGIAKTGVKFVHKRAKEFDIGIYFESNGHGTIIYKPRIVEIIKKLEESAKDPEVAQIVQDFKVYLTQQNNINGDAIGNMMLILSSLEILDIEVNELFTCYTDNHSIVGKVKLSDRTLMRSSEDERVLAEPADIQPQIDEILKPHKGYIAFVRPSGTEDVCRVYVEGKEEAVLKELESKLKKIVVDHPLLKLN